MVFHAVLLLLSLLLPSASAMHSQATAGYTAQRWRLRAPASALTVPPGGSSKEWRVFAVRFLADPTCSDATTAIDISASTSGATSSATVCNSDSAFLCGFSNVPKYAFEGGKPGSEQYSSAFSAWKGKADTTACAASPLGACDDVWLSIDLGTPTSVGCIQLFQAGSTASFMYVDASATQTGAWHSVLFAQLHKPPCPTDSTGIATTSCCETGWSCNEVEVRRPCTDLHLSLRLHSYEATALAACSPQPCSELPGVLPLCISSSLARMSLSHTRAHTHTRTHTYTSPLVTRACLSRTHTRTRARTRTRPLSSLVRTQSKPIMPISHPDQCQRIGLDLDSGQCCVVIFHGATGEHCDPVPVWDLGEWTHPGPAFERSGLCGTVR